MKNIRIICAVVLCAIVIAPQLAYGGSNPGPVKFSVMTRVETHSKISDADTESNELSGETFGYFSISAFRELQKNTFGSLLYLNKYSFDENEIASHIGGLTIIHLFNKRWVGTLGYIHTSDPSVGALQLETSTRDRFSITGICKFNPKSKRGPLYGLTSSFSTVSDWNEQQSLSEKFTVRFPHVSKKLKADLSYNYSYSLKQNEQLTNQFNGRLTYTYKKRTKLSLGVLFIDNVYTDNQGDDTVFRFTVNRALN